MRHLLPCAFLLGALSALADGSGGDPLTKALKLLADLKGSVTEDAHRQSETYKKYGSWCEKTTAELDREVSNAKKSIAKSLADMSEVEASLAESGTTLEALANQVARNDAKLTEMKKVREEDEKAFTENKKSLEDSIKLLDKAQKAIADGMKSEEGDSFLQAQVRPEDSGSVSQALLGLAAVIDAAGLQTRTAAQLAALLQTSEGQEREEDADADGANDAQAGPAYSASSSQLVDLIKKMTDEAEESLKSVVEMENKAKADFSQLSASLDRQIQKDNVDMAAERKSQQKNLAEKAKLTGHMDTTEKEMETTKSTFEDTQVACLQAAADQEASEAGRKEELAALDEAVKALKSATSLTNQDTGGVVFLQLSSESDEEFTAGSASQGAKAMAADVTLPEADAENFDISSPEETAPQSTVVLNVIRKMADQQKSPILAQLASTVSTAIRASGGGDPLANVRKIVADHIRRMEESVAKDTSEDQYCKTEIGRTEARLKELQHTVKTGQVYIDKATSDAALLKQETQDLQEEITKLAKEEVELLKNHKEFTEGTKKAKEDLERGMDGIRSAIDTLKQYYTSQTSELQISSQSVSLLEEPQDSKEVASMKASMGMDEAPLEGDQDSQALEASDANLGLIQEDQQANVAPKPPQPYRARIDAGSGVITILEACETDFAEQLAKLETQARDRNAQHKDMLFKNKMMHAAKSKSIEVNTKEFKDLEAEAREGKKELEAAKKELTPLSEYYDQVKERCSFKARREAAMKQREKDIAALKEAFSILSGEAALAQLASRPLSMSFLQRRAPRIA